MTCLKRLSILLKCCFIATGLAGCSTGKLVLKSVPEGADVISPNGRKIGSTPFTMNRDALDKIQSGAPYILLEVKKPGYDSKSLIVERRFYEELQIILKKQDELAFQSDITTYYSKPSSTMVADFLKAQALLMAKDFNEAETAIANLITSYPSLAPAYVLQADLRLAQGKKNDAIKSLHQALRITPHDPALQKSLASLGVIYTPPTSVNKTRAPASANKGVKK